MQTTLTSFCQVPPYPIGDAPDCMKTNILDISTGWNHHAGNFFWPDELEEYWSILSADGTPMPLCATTWDWWQHPGFASFATLFPNTRPISNVTTLALSNNNAGVGVGTCPLMGTQYIFRRSFYVDNAAGAFATLNIVGGADDCLFDAQMNGVAIPFIGTNCTQSGFPNFFPAAFTALSPGINFLDIEVRNRNTPGGGGTSPMALIISASLNIIGATADFIRNEYFVPNTDANWGCASPNHYIQLPEFDRCIPAGAASGIVTITNYDPFFTYHVEPLNINSTGTFTGLAGVTYTVTVIDPRGCELEEEVTVFNSPDFSIAPLNQCVPVGTQGTVTLNTTNPVTSYGFQINGGIVQGYNNPNLGLNPGQYTITCIDPNAGNCTSTAIANVGNFPTVIGSATPPCIDGNTSSLLWATATPVLLGNSFNIVGPGAMNINITSTTITQNTQPGATGIYTVTVTEPYAGCQGTTTISVFPTPDPALILTSSKGCLSPPPNINTAIITATPNNPGNYTYQLNGGTPQASNQFTINSPGTYSINVISANNCPSTPATIYIGDCMMCDYDYPPANAQWFKNATSSIVFGNVTPTGPIVIDGTLTVDDDLNVWNNPNVYFTKNAKMNMTNTATNSILYVLNSTLKPCSWWWAGLLATDVKQEIRIENSTVQGMWMDYTAPTSAFFDQGGVNLSNGAKITATHSNFINNLNSIVINRALQSAYPGVIEGNRFVSQQIINNNSTMTGFAGVRIHDVVNAQVGDYNNINGGGNSFEKLRNGVEIHAGSNAAGSPLSSYIKAYNNEFKDIQNYSIPAGMLHDIQVISAVNTSAGVNGRAVSSSNGVTPNLTVEVRNLTNIFDDNITFFPIFNNCDRGIETNQANLIADKLYMVNSMLGMMNSPYKPKSFNITDNYIEHAHIGINISGAIYNSNIVNNIISSRNSAVMTQYPNPYFASPIGIDIEHLYSNPAGIGIYNLIKDNTIGINSITGIGVRLLNGDSHQQVGNNYISFGTVSVVSSQVHLIKALYGIWNENSSGCLIDNNTTHGIVYPNIWNVRNSVGIYMNQSPKCTLSCNKTKYTRYGFYAWGDNTTPKENVTFNKFKANAFPWYFLDNGSASPSTFGDVGDGGTDNGNEFIALSSPVNWLGQGGFNPGLFKVFRNSVIPSTDYIYTDPGILVWAESGATTAGAGYQVQDPAVGYSDAICLNPVFLMGGNDTTNYEIDSSELEQALNVVDDSMEYINYPEVGNWIDKYRLYERLETDSMFRNSNPELLYFYSQQQYSNIGAINIAERKINLLADSSTNESNFTVRFADAFNANEEIDNGEEWEMNMKQVNNIRLKLLAGVMDTIGYDTLYIDSVTIQTVPILLHFTSDEKEFLREMAGSCPFVSGLAVYKARPFWSMIRPGAVFDDRILCLVGQSKNLDYANIDIDSLYESQIKENYKMQVNNPVQSKVLTEGEILVYPNPASTQINIQYRCKKSGIFVLYNGVGQEVLKSELTSGSMRVSLLTNDLATGVYTYRCIFKGCETKNGKLIIVK